MEDPFGRGRRQILWFFSMAACMKLLLIPLYHSTDFEVHRHWLALTHSLPLSKWYSDEFSPWTLDYRPFFAYFERFLSIFAHLVNPQIVDIHNDLNYKANSVIYFQRISVILSDLCLLLGLYRLTKKLDMKKRDLTWVLIVWSPSPVIVDHLHFHYNGFLLGLLLLSISFLQEGRDLMAGFVFAVLLCFKHLLAVAAPVYFVYLLRHYCWKGLVRGFACLTIMGAIVVAVYVAAYLPFLYHGQITPATTFMIVLLALSSCLIKGWRNPRSAMITRWIGYAYTCGFLFGWHVHEKASLHFVIPLAIVAVQSLEDARHYFFLSIVSCYSLFPLLYEAQECPIKVLSLLLHSVVMWLGFSAQHAKDVASKATAPLKNKGSQSKLKESTSAAADRGEFVIGWIGKTYLFGLWVVEIWGQVFHPFLLGNKLLFVPLMLVSMYCALGMMYSWIWQLRWIIRSTLLVISIPIYSDLFLLHFILQIRQLCV